ncbi:MAG: SPOR domain-containing protein [Alphaproteobacteria bacterium]
MPDKKDPQLSRKGDAPPRDTNAPMLDDPLAELARIVSGKPATSDAPRPRPAPRPTTPAASPPDASADILGDLEAELLSNLQASFSAVDTKQSAASQAPTPPPPPARPPVDPAPSVESAPAEPPADDPLSSPAADPFRPTGPAADTPPPSTTRPPAPFRPSPPQPAPSVETGIDLAALGLEAPEAETPPPAAAAPEPAAPTERRWPPPMDELDDDWRDDSGLSQAPKATPPSVEPAAPPAEVSGETHTPEPAAPERPPFVGRRVDIGSLPLRRGAAAKSTPETTGQTPRQTPRNEQARWNGPAQRPPPETSRYAPRSVQQTEARVDPPVTSAAAPQAPEPRLHQAPSPQPEPQSGASAPINDGFAREIAAEAVHDSFDAAEDGGFMPPFETDDLDGLIGRRRIGNGVIAIAAVLALVVIGGGVAMLMLGGNNGEPPIITADATPTRVAPPAPADSGDAQNKLIYDRVDANGVGGEALVLQPGAERLSDRLALDDNPIARVILPGPTDGSIDPATAVSDLASDLAGSASEIIDLAGPRRVRTVVVRPDGTIVSNQVQTPSAEAVPLEPAAPAVTIEPAPTNNDTLAIAGRDTVGSGNELAITPLPDTAGPVPAPVVRQTQPIALQPALPRRTVAAADPNAPLNLSPNGVQTAPPAVASNQPAPAASGMLVQISSQRSEDSARTTFRELRARYPGILGPYEVDIQRADLGDRGIYYRVRVGPFSPGDAQRLCDDLKAAGGDCILARS